MAQEATELYKMSRTERDVMIALAAVGPCPGLRVKERVEEMRDDSVSHGGIYPVLSDLFERGLIDKQAKDGRTYLFKLTEEGSDLVTAYAKEIAKATGL